MEPVEHLGLSFLQKKMTSYSQKWFSQKSSTLDVWNGPK